MSRPSQKSIAHPMLMAIQDTQGRIGVLERRLQAERDVRDGMLRAALAAGLTQADCARAMDVSRHRISQLVRERGLLPPEEGEAPPPDLGNECHQCGAPGWIVRAGVELLCTECARGTSRGPTTGV